MYIQIIFLIDIVMMSNTRQSASHKHHDLEEEREKMLEMWTENQSSNHNDLKIEKNNFFVPKCYACKNEMQFSEGDVIYGDKWYHIGCWKEPEKIKLLTQ
jgi:hypothetical protein